VKTARARNAEARAPYVVTLRSKRSRHNRRRPRRLAGDWHEEIPSREHIPFEERTVESIEISSRLSKLPMIGREEPEDVLRMVPSEINPILRSAGIDFVLAGAHGLATWLAQPRSTQDVDYIIRERDALPELKLEKHPDLWRFQRKDQYVLDLILTRTPLHKRVFKEYAEAGEARDRYRVPKIEAALAMKFAAFTGHYRPAVKKMQDAADFIAVVTANKNMDFGLLRELGELVYRGGGAEIVQYIEDVRAGRTLKF
jgi:hypothetical protein